MATGDKLLDRMVSNPRGDWTISDVEKLCQENGLICGPPRGGGSHYRVSDPRGAFRQTIPARRPIKPVYIRVLVRFILEQRSRP
jgi:hypothetical protein